MKTLSLSIVFLVCFFSLNGQHYFPSDSARWRMHYEFLDAGNQTHYLEDIAFSGDTIIRFNKVFRKLFEPSNGFGLFMGKNGPYLYIDSINNRVDFLLHKTDTFFTPLYDFSLSVGDSMETLEQVYWPTTWYVIQDSTLTLNGEQRRYLRVERFIGINRQEDIWIEGIGSIHGLFSPLLEIPYSFEFGFNLSCFTDSAINLQYEPLEFFNDIYFYCASVFSTPEEDIDSHIKVYPNPYSEELYLENLYFETLTYAIYSADGKKIIEVSLNPQSKYSLNVEKWRAGFYTVLVATENQELIQKRKITHF